MVCGRLNMLVFFMVMGLAVSNAQTTHTVGGALGWTIPQGGAAAYTSWASGQKFTVGDVLLFNFATGAHTAAEVTKGAYDACTTTGTLSQFSTGPARVTLNSSGQHYYLCTFPGHCSAGQKLAINVSAAASTPPPAAAPTPAATPPPASAPAPVPTPPPASAPAPVPTPPPASAPTPRATPPPASTPSPPATPPPSPTTSPPPSGTNPSTPTPTGATAPPPPPNSAASFVGVALPVTFLSVAMALFY